MIKASSVEETSSMTSNQQTPYTDRNHQVHQATMFQHSASVPNYAPQRPTVIGRSVSQREPIKEESPTFFPDQPYNYDPNFPRGRLGSDEQWQSQDNQRHRKPTNFLSSAADLEYSQLSNILQDNFMGLNPNHSATSTEGTPNSVNLSPVLSPHGMLQKNVPSPSNLGASSYSAGAETTTHSAPSQKAQIYHGSEFPRCDVRINQYFLELSNERSAFPDVIQAIEAMRDSDPSVFYERNQKSALSFAIETNAEDQTGNINDDNGLHYSEPESIYATVKKPFSYTPGFHKLIAYLRSRFPKEMLVKMAESMASYRPSFIACTNSLREADLIFMEQCFQRTLLTYDNFIKVSGTPTIVWRRTGEIAYVGREFSILTGWTKDQLMGQKINFIVELLDDKSVVEYFQLFSRIAFGDFLGATMTECTLLTPKHDVKIRTGCIWTLKRDVFGIPMMVIGNFLPIV
ncbi:uncharacterized protein CXQ87_003743 [Candidozyma duobushaemuli]|uniref:PAS domain-containing protein n=2 Tax=Candidozyma TaxID=3303203 RepID=A0ABX8I820_9ASCO|nr:uncharacterized protein CXQ87_003743 [[Candida] duobushaemulonis]PVH15886.1 hypothetical protein CXQ87_003743 [[Candida] duobushaemulonis]QWU89415.1 hypothetical protein CA3LBN_003738 [[Candida] haemuloni]